MNETGVQRERNNEKPVVFECKGKVFEFYGAQADVSEGLIFIQARKPSEATPILLTLDVSNPQMALRTLGVCLMTNYENEAVDIVGEMEMRAIEVREIGGTFEELDVEENYRYDMCRVIEKHDISRLLVTSRKGVALGRYIIYADLGGVETTLFVTTSLGVLELDKPTVSDALYEEICNMADNLVKKREVLRV